MPFHQWLLKSRVLVQVSLYAQSIAGTPHGEVRNIHPHQMKSMRTSNIFVVETPILKLPSFFGKTLCLLWNATLIMHLQNWKNYKGIILRWFVTDIGFFSKIGTA